MNPSILVLCINVLLTAPYVAVSWHSYERLHNGFFGERFCKAEAKEPWSYSGKNGPKYWGYNYPSCNGMSQSPIDISSHDAFYDANLAKLFMYNYDIPVSRATIDNDGHTVRIAPSDGVRRYIVIRGSTYRLQQLHFHWGDKYYHGSEHTIDGIQYALELHFVHENNQNQTAVVAVLFKEQFVGNAELQNVIKHFPKVMFNDTRTPLTSELKLENLLPENPTSFFTYQGSLTVPECNRGVTWFVLPYPLPVGKEQMDYFRKLYSTTRLNASPKCKISNNYRPLQPLNNRKVYFSQ